MPPGRGGRAGRLDRHEFFVPSRHDAHDTFGVLFMLGSPQPPVDLLPSSYGANSPRVAAGLYLCGDYRESGTLDGALLSGRRAAEAVLADYASS